MNRLQTPATQPRSPAFGSSNPRHVTFSVVGAFVGLLAFLAAALLPAMMYGGVAGVRLATGVFGVPSAHPYGVNAFVVTGIVCSVTAIAALFAAMGAVAGASVGALSSLSAEGKGEAPHRAATTPGR
jgi:hypothetical protein